MKITINEKELDAVFTFNSFKYLTEFDISSMADIGTKPFKMAEIVTDLLYAALNNNPKEKHSKIEVETFIEEYIATNPLPDLLEDLTKELETSNFFKSLQMKSKRKK